MNAKLKVLSEVDFQRSLIKPNSATPDPAPTALKCPFPGRWQSVFSTDHRVIACSNFFLSLSAVLIGMGFHCYAHTYHLAAAENSAPGEIKPETIGIHDHARHSHGLFVLSTAPLSAFGNLILPAQIGAREWPSRSSTCSQFGRRSSHFS